MNHNATNQRVFSTTVADENEFTAKFIWKVTRNGSNIRMTNLYSQAGIPAFDINASGFFNPQNSTEEDYKPASIEEKSYTLQGIKNNADGAFLALGIEGSDYKLKVANSAENASVFQFFEISAHHSQAVSAPEPEPGTYYIRARSYCLYGITSPYIAENGGAMKLVAGNELENTPGALWKISKPDLSANPNYNQERDGTAFNIQNAFSKQYWTTGPSAPLGTNARYYNIQYDDETGAYTFHGYTNNDIEGPIGNKGNVYPSSATAFARFDVNAVHSFLEYYELIPVKTNEVSFKYLDPDGQTQKTETLELNTGINSASALSCPENYAAYTCEPSVIESNTEEVTVSCIGVNRYYRMQLRPGGSPTNYDMYYDRELDEFSGSETNIPIKTRKSEQANEFSLERLWYLEQVGTTFPAQVILHNAAVGESRGVTAPNTSGSLCTFTQTPTVFNVVTSSASGGSGIALQHSGATSLYLNDVEGNLGVYNGGQNVPGSLFKLTTPQITEENIRSLTTYYGEPNSDILGAYFKLDATKKEAAAQSPTFENIQALLTPTFDGSVDTNKYYTITFCRDYKGSSAMTLSGYADKEGAIDENSSGEENARTVQMEPKANTNVSQLWKFEKIDNNYMLINANCPNYYVDTPRGGQTTTHIVSSSESAVKIMPTARSVHNAEEAYNGIKWVLSYDNDGTKQFNARNDSKYICQYQYGFDDKGNIVEIRSVESVPVTIGDTHWATLCLPFATEIPEGVKVYTAESATESYVTLAELSGTLPANTGVLISIPAETSTPATYDFLITPNAATAAENKNLLTGVTLRRQGYEEGSHYGLKASDEDPNGVVLAKNGTANVPANKAILEIASPTTAGALRLGLPGSVTGIDSAATATESTDNVVFYDLNGQRVLRPTTGIYVTGDGRKVFVK